MDTKSLEEPVDANADDIIVLMFHNIWSMLAVGFGAGFAGKALRKLHELEQPEK